MGQKTELLDWLFARVGCEYLSDMKDGHWRGELLRALRAAQPEDYSWAQWSAALSYLFEEAVSLSSREEVLAFLAAKEG